MPRLSVLLPVRNAARTVRAAVVSILRQTERDLSLVVRRRRLRRRDPADPRARSRRETGASPSSAGPGEGIALALNRGLASCDAPLVVRMDADDLAHPARLAAHLRGARRRSGPRRRRLAGCALFPRRGRVRAGMARYAAWLNALATPDLVAARFPRRGAAVHSASIARGDEPRAAWRLARGPFPEDYDLGSGSPPREAAGEPAAHAPAPGASRRAG